MSTPRIGFIGIGMVFMLKKCCEGELFVGKGKLGDRLAHAPLGAADS